MADSQRFDLDEVPEHYVRNRALADVVANLGPAPFLALPFTLMVSAVMADEADHVRLAWWNLAAVVATLAMFLALAMYRRANPDEPPRRVLTALQVACGLIGLLYGMSTWVAGGGSSETVLLFALFPATVSAVSAMITAGRRDLYLCILIPTMVAAGFGLVSTGDDRLVGLTVVSVFFAVVLVILHQVVSGPPTAAIRLRWQSNALLNQLQAERAVLESVNDQLALTNSQLAHQATHDPLTGLPNRRGTLDELDRLLAHVGPTNHVALLYCDLDHFKSINDTLGHHGGDQFISVLADRLARSLEHGCVAGRIGGDEFIVMLPGHDLGAASAVAARLIGVIAQPVRAEGREMPSSISIGVATAPENGTTSSDLLRNANAALYRAKSSGRNRVELFDGAIQRELLSRVETEQHLRRAVDDGEILPFFQPEIDASSGNIVGAELLARWVRRDGTVLPAGEFMNAAAQAGLLEKLTERVLHHARPQIRRWAALGLPDGFRFRINVAPTATERTWRDNPIDQLIQGIEPSLLSVDVSESAVISDLPSAAANLASFRARGGRVCLDDFARGVSSLSLLRRLPLDEVRIDRVAIDTITAHPHDRAIVRAIIALVREIGLSVTADGVETGPQADALIALGCVRQQGHLYSRALPADEFESFLLDRMAERFARTDDDNSAWATNELGDA